jgi:hypothetical protein
MRFPNGYGVHVLIDCTPRAKLPLPSKLFIPGRKMEVMYLTERLRLVRLWKQLSGNGQRFELWASHGQLGGNASRLMRETGLQGCIFPVPI